ncbi:deoxyribose-phosphate aldolase [Nemorincola caseinilytica]|uniref:Deoxyribose-phosphate aldolase n=1 Tax=Nemorincola caseinilytica TaxID=2054315 RepID=A0ABP8NKI1_9BACT
MSFNLASYIDHTILKQTTTVAEVDKVCVEASMAGFVSVCIPPRYVAGAKKLLDGSKVKVATVIGFPLGYNATEVKVREIEEAIHMGADELDMVIDLCALKSGDWKHLTHELEACMAPVYQAGRILKVIVESGMLTDSELIACCQLYGKYEIDFMKTSTGFSGTGATIHAVRMMREFLPARIGIKASGGIRDYEFARQLIDAGANRLGCSSSMQLMKEFKVATGA